MTPLHAVLDISISSTYLFRLNSDHTLYVGKIYQPLLMQSSYKSELLASCKDIRLRASRIKNEASICMQRRMVDMDQSIHVQHDILRNTNQNSAQSLEIMQRLYRLLLSSEARFFTGQNDYSKS